MLQGAAVSTLMQRLVPTHFCDGRLRLKYPHEPLQKLLSLFPFPLQKSLIVRLSLHAFITQVSISPKLLIALCSSFGEFADMIRLVVISMFTSIKKKKKMEEKERLKKRKISRWF